MTHTAPVTLALSAFVAPALTYLLTLPSTSCLGGAVVERRTRDRKVAGLTPGRSAIKSTRSTQQSSAALAEIYS